jgi:hypothetical protein
MNKGLCPFSGMRDGLLLPRLVPTVPRRGLSYLASSRSWRKVQLKLCAADPRSRRLFFFCRHLREARMDNLSRVGGLKSEQRDL